MDCSLLVLGLCGSGRASSCCVEWSLKDLKHALCRPDHQNGCCLLGLTHSPHVHTGSFQAWHHWSSYYPPPNTTTNENFSFDLWDPIVKIIHRGTLDHLEDRLDVVVGNLRELATKRAFSFSVISRKWLVPFIDYETY